MTVTRIDLGAEYLGGLAKPTVDDVGKLAVVALDALGRPNFQYLTQTATVANDAFATTLAPHLRGVGLTVDSSGNLRTRTRPRRLQEHDSFSTGTNASGAIGRLGWNLLGTGTPAYARIATQASLATTRKATLSTSASANNRSVLSWGLTEAGTVALASEIITLQCGWSFNSSITTKRVFFGLHDDLAVEPSAAVNCLGVYFDSAVDADNYQIIARSASTGSPTVTSAVVPTNTNELITLYQPTAGTWQVYVGNTQIGGNLTTNIPAVALNIGFRVETLAASAASIRLGYFGINADLADAMNDDAFLEV